MDQLERNGTRGSDPNAALENLGYKSELPRNLSMMSILGLYAHALLLTQEGFAANSMLVLLLLWPFHL